MRHSGRSIILLDNFFAEDVSQIEEIESHVGFEADVALCLTIAVGCYKQTGCCLYRQLSDDKHRKVRDK